MLFESKGLTSNILYNELLCLKYMIINQYINALTAFYKISQQCLLRIETTSVMPNHTS